MAYSLSDLELLLADPISFWYGRASGQGRSAASQAVMAGFRQIGVSQSDPEVARLLIQFRSNKISAVQSLLSGIAADYNIRIAAYRGDWLACEAYAVDTMNRLLWAMMLEKEVFTLPTGHHSSFAESYCAETGCGDLFAAALSPASLRGWVESVFDLVLGVTHSFQQQYPDLTVENVELLHTLQNDPSRLFPWPVEGIKRTESVLATLAKHLADLPVHIGLLLTGSLAVDFKRDQFSDIDLFCFCSAIPDDTVRDRFLESVGARKNWRCGVFEYIDMPGAGVHLLFIPIENQHWAFRELYEAGIEVGEVDFSDENRSASFAASAYRWASGCILSDTEGALAGFQERARQYPAQLQERVYQSWVPVWDEHYPIALKALAQRDHLVGLTALHRCIEAALRVLLARHQVYANPCDDPKWLVLEIANLPASQRKAIEPALKYIPANIGDSLERRLDMIGELWKLANPHESA